MLFTVATDISSAPFFVTSDGCDNCRDRFSTGGVCRGVDLRRCRVLRRVVRLISFFAKFVFVVGLKGGF